MIYLDDDYPNRKGPLTIIVQYILRKSHVFTMFVSSFSGQISCLAEYIMYTEADAR